MSTPTRQELAAKVGTIKAVTEQIIQEMRMIDERLAGLFAFIQMLPEYEETVEKLKAKAEENQKQEEETKLDL
jgi:sensor histidine kinase YesM